MKTIAVVASGATIGEMIRWASCTGTRRRLSCTSTGIDFLFLAGRCARAWLRPNSDFLGCSPDRAQ